MTPDEPRLIPGDCLEILPTLPDSSVHLIVTDPPYHRVKGEDWDRQWKTDADYLAWIGRLCDQWQRVLKPNGSLYCFASPRMAARVEVTIREWFAVLNSIVWRKSEDNGSRRHVAQLVDKGLERSWFPATERIVFAEQFGADNRAKGESGWVAKCDEVRGFVFEPLRAYLDSERRRAGIDKADCNVACGFSRSAGGMASRHYFSRSQWCLPTAEHYSALQRLFNANGGDYLRRDYEDLRRDYEDLRRDYEDLRRDYEDLRRPFAVDASVPYTDVWDFPTVPARPGKHPCEKPYPLIAHIIRTSSRPGDVVLDCCAGSGVTGEAARDLGRSAILIEKDPKWCGRIAERLGSPRLLFA